MKTCNILYMVMLLGTVLTVTVRAEPFDPNAGKMNIAALEKENLAYVKVDGGRGINEKDEAIVMMACDRTYFESTPYGIVWGAGFLSFGASVGIRTPELIELHGLCLKNAKRSDLARITIEGIAGKDTKRCVYDLRQELNPKDQKEYDEFYFEALACFPKWEAYWSEPPKYEPHYLD